MTYYSRTAVALLFCVMPFTTFAAGPTYTSFKEIGTDGFTLTVKTLGSQSYARCAFDTKTCTTVDEQFKLATTTTARPSLEYDALPPGASWLAASPDGKYVAYYIPATQKQTTRTFGVLDTQSETVYESKEKNMQYWDLLSDGVRIFSFSPDSSKLLLLSDKAGPPTLYQVDLTTLTTKGFKPTRLIARSYTISDFGWINARTIFFTANREGPYSWHLYRYTLGGDAPTRIAKNTSYASTIRTTTQGLLFTTIDGNTAVPKLYSTTTNILSSFTIANMSSSSAPKAQVVVSAGLTGAYWKANSATTTLVVWLHGGPFRQTSLGYHSYFSYAGYDWVLSELVDAGVPVLKLDYPGSYGYGKTFAESLRLAIGTKDVKDATLAVTKFAKLHGFTKIYLVGNSYGGYLGPKMLVEKPKSFSGAFAIAGVWDWSWLTQQLQTSIFNVQFDGVETSKNANLYAAAALYDRFDALTTQKIVIAHGDADTDIPFTQSKAAYDMLHYLGKNVTFLPFADEDHIFVKKDSFVRLCQAVLAFAGATADTHCAL